MPSPNKSKKMSRSARLKRYENVYTKVLKKSTSKSSSKQKVRKNPQKNPRSRTTRPKEESTPESTRTRPETIKTSKLRSKRLTCYQKFVRSESKKPKYKSLAPRDRMTAIGASWVALKTKK